MAWWYRSYFHLPTTDPRFLNATRWEMLDDYNAWREMLEMQRGGGDTTDYDTEGDEIDLLEELDALGPLPDGATPAAVGDDWEDVPLDDLLQDLDGIE